MILLPPLPRPRLTGLHQQRHANFDWGLKHLGVDQAFVQSKLDTNIFLMPPGCGRISSKVARLNKTIFGLKQSGRFSCKLPSSTLVECGFEPCLVDPCVFRLILNGEVVAMLVVHVDDINLVATKEVTDSVVADLNKIFAMKHLAEVTWYMGSEFKHARGIVSRKLLKFRRLDLVEMLSSVSMSPKPVSSPLLQRWTSGT